MRARFIRQRIEDLKVPLMVLYTLSILLAGMVVGAAWQHRKDFPPSEVTHYDRHASPGE